jgi:hypothetical protein
MALIEWWASVGAIFHRQPFVVLDPTKQNSKQLPMPLAKSFVLMCRLLLLVIEALY